MTKKIIKLIMFIIVIYTLINHKDILKRFYPIYYEESIKKYSIKYGLDPYLIYSIINVESKFNAFAKSSKGAIGLMQITPNTGEYISRLIGDKKFKMDILYNPETNIRYGCFYVSKLFSDFNGDLDCVLAAYNGGEGNVRKWLKEGNLKVKDLPFKETKNYIYKVKRNYKLYNYIYSDQSFFIFFNNILVEG